MKRTFIKFACFFLPAFFSHVANAQFSTGIGPRIGISLGFTVLQNFNPKARGAADFIIVNQYKGWVFTGLYEVHSKSHNIHIELANFGFFWGAGGHVGLYKGINYNQSDKNKVQTVGVDVIAGVEWKLPHVPLLLSLDVKPYVDINYRDQPDFIDAAIALKYLFYVKGHRPKF
ncbi:MAG: hypothetical protein WC868_07775 [Bacteroidales bacterium]